MAPKMQLGSQKLFLILTVLSCCRSLKVSIPEAEYEVASGNDIMMICNFIPANPDIKLLILKWQYFPDNIDEPLKNVATFFSNNPTDIAPGYEGRAVLEVDVASQVSTLTLKKVTIEDSRNYQCSVTIPNDDEGITAATTSLLVLVPPSKPICGIQGKAEYWQNITLTCMSEQGSPKPTYEWTSYSVGNLPRPLPPKTIEKNGALSLFNISRETSGFFICMSTNRVGSASCNLTLAVMPGSMNIGATAGIVGGVLIGLLCLAILIFCCCRKRGKKDQKDQYAEGSAGEMAFFDSDAPEAETKQKVNQYEDKDVPEKSYISETAGHRFEDDQHNYVSGRERHDAKGSDIDTQRYQGDQHDHYHGSRDHLEDQQDRYGGSRSHLDDRRNYNSGSRDRLNDQRDRYGGSRDRLEDQQDRYGGSRDHLDDRRNYNSGSRDRLNDQRDRYGGSRDGLNDRHNYNSGSCDRLNDQRDRYGGSRDRLKDQQDHYRGSRDHLNDYPYRADQHDHYGGSRNNLDFSQ